MLLISPFYTRNEVMLWCEAGLEFSNTFKVSSPQIKLNPSTQTSDKKCITLWKKTIVTWGCLILFLLHMFFSHSKIRSFAFNKWIKCMYKAPQTQRVKASTFHYNWYTFKSQTCWANSLTLWLSGNWRHSKT